MLFLICRIIVQSLNKIAILLSDVYFSKKIGDTTPLSTKIKDIFAY